MSVDRTIKSSNGVARAKSPRPFENKYPPAFRAVLLLDPPLLPRIDRTQVSVSLPRASGVVLAFEMAESLAPKLGKRTLKRRESKSGKATYNHVAPVAISGPGTSCTAFSCGRSADRDEAINLTFSLKVNGNDEARAVLARRGECAPAPRRPTPGGDNYLPVRRARLLDPQWGDDIYRLQLRKLASRIKFTKQTYTAALNAAVKEVSFLHFPGTPRALEEEGALDANVKLSQLELCVDLPVGPGFDPEWLLDAAREISSDIAPYEKDGIKGIRGSLKLSGARNLRLKIYLKGTRREQLRFEIAHSGAAISEEYERQVSTSGRPVYLRWLRKCLVTPVSTGKNGRVINGVPRNYILRLNHAAYKGALRRITDDTYRDLATLIQPLRERTAGVVRQVISNYLAGPIDVSGLRMRHILPTRTRKETPRRMRRLVERLAEHALGARDLSSRQRELLRLLVEHGVAAKDDRGIHRLTRNGVARWRAGLL